MTSVGNNFDYFPENQLHFVTLFDRFLMIFLLKLFVSMRNEEATASSCLNVATGLIMLQNTRSVQEMELDHEKCIIFVILYVFLFLTTTKT